MFSWDSSMYFNVYSMYFNVYSLYFNVYSMRFNVYCITRVSIHIPASLGAMYTYINSHRYLSLVLRVGTPEITP